MQFRELIGVVVEIFVLFDKNVGNYNFSETLSNSTNLARLYQYSTLLKKNIIKYEKRRMIYTNLYLICI